MSNEQILKIKAEFFPKIDEVYSICMRGARVWDKSKILDIYTNGNSELIDTSIRIRPSFYALIVSQQHFKFDDLGTGDTIDNYDKNVRGNKDKLHEAMKSVYADFSNREIITILKFKVYE